MKKIKLALSLVMLNTMLFAQTVTVDGNAFLEQQTIHDSIKVLFVRTAPSALKDSTYTGSNGYYSINLSTGIYDVTYLKKGYLPITLNKAFYVNTTLTDTTLEGGLLGALSDTLYTGVYKVVGNIRVDSTDTLVIQPGVKLLFKQGVQFDINGLLNAVGTPTDSIIFTGYIDSTRWGGIDFNYGSGNSILSYSLIEHSNSSGIYVGAGTSPTLNHLLIRKNSTTSTASGAGMIMFSDLVLDNITISDNTSNFDGGGIHFRGNNLKIINSEILRNVCGGGVGGPGIFMNGGKIELENVKIKDNTTTGSYGEGIIVCFGEGVIFLTNVEITGNSDGGIYIDNDSITLIGTNNVITGGIKLSYSDGCKLSMSNSIITGGISCPSTNKVINITNCNFCKTPLSLLVNVGSWTGVNVTVNANGDSCDAWGNINLDPLFVDTANGDYHLQPGSPCINAGVNDSVKTQTDLDGNPRINNAVVDMGAYEYQYNNVLSGIAFNDANGNKVKDTLEQVLPNQLISLQNGQQYTTTNSLGEYDFYLNTGTFKVSIVPKQYWELTTDSASYTVTISSFDSVITNLDFGLKVIPNIHDVSVNLTGGATRAGFNANYWLNYKNEGTEKETGTLSLQYDSLLTFVSSSVLPTSNTNHLLEWNYDTLAPFEARMIKLQFTIPQLLGTDLTSIAFITPVIGDTNTTNNNDTLVQTITGSYDPNDKQVYPEGEQTQHYVLHGQQLTYTIRFQNTGTDTAFTVVIEDTLDASMNVETFKLLASSHPVEYSIGGTGILTFTFNNILLPDSNKNEPESQGFVKFSVEPKANLADNTKVDNTAYIYFDYNPAIVTNKVFNTYVSSIVTAIKSTPITLSGDIVIYPNPSTGIFNIVIKEITKPAELSVMNIQGQVVYNEKLFDNNTTKQLDMSGYPKGIYFLKLMNEDVIRVEKVVVQ